MTSHLSIKGSLITSVLISAVLKPPQELLVYKIFINMNLTDTLYETAVDLYTETTYRYREGRNTVPNRLDFDTQKLIDCGAIVICKGMNGDPESPDYKKHLNDGSTNLITLYNIKHSIKNNPDSWILEAIKHPITIAPIGWNDMSLETYDGKYNQILWSLKKLGIPYKEMLKHNSLNF